MTSIECRNEAYKLVREKCGQGQADVYIELTEYEGGLTDHALAFQLDESLAWVNARRNELVNLGLVVAYGKIYNKDTKTSRTLWKAVTNLEPKIQVKKESRKQLLAEIDRLRGIIDEMEANHKEQIAELDNRIGRLIAENMRGR